MDWDAIKKAIEDVIAQGEAKLAEWEAGLPKDAAATAEMVQSLIQPILSQALDPIKAEIEDQIRQAIVGKSSRVVKSSVDLA